MRVALYARVSTKDKGQDVENQLVALREFVARQPGWTIIRTYVDKVSGSLSVLKREALHDVFLDASRREFDLLMFWSLDRLSREGVLKTLNMLNQLSSYGVDWKSYTEQYLDSCGVFKEAVLSILATIAKQERVRISERVHAGLRKARGNGVQLGRKRIKIEAEQLRELEREGFSLREIADELNISASTVANRLNSLAAWDLQRGRLEEEETEQCPT